MVQPDRESTRRDGYELSIKRWRLDRNEEGRMRRESLGGRKMEEKEAEFWQEDEGPKDNINIARKQRTILR